jgi:putative transcriptional regulator
MRTRIKEFRARHDLTQAELAKIVGVRRETIVFLEKGRYNPSLRLAHDVAKALGSSIDELFIFDDDEPGEESG